MLGPPVGGDRAGNAAAPRRRPGARRRLEPVGRRSSPAPAAEAVKSKRRSRRPAPELTATVAVAGSLEAGNRAELPAERRPGARARPPPRGAPPARARRPSRRGRTAPSTTATPPASRAGPSTGAGAGTPGGDQVSLHGVHGVEARRVAASPVHLDHHAVVRPAARSPCYAAHAGGVELVARRPRCRAPILAEASRPPRRSTAGSVAPKTPPLVEPLVAVRQRAHRPRR